MSSMERDEVTIIESNRTMAILSLSLSVSLSHYFSLTRSFPYYTYTFETTLHRGQQYYCESLKARYKDRRFAIFSKRTKTIRIDERRCSSLATPKRRFISPTNDPRSAFVDASFSFLDLPTIRGGGFAFKRRVRRIDLAGPVRRDARADESTAARSTS